MYMCLIYKLNVYASLFVAEYWMLFLYNISPSYTCAWCLVTSLPLATMLSIVECTTCTCSTTSTSTWGIYPNMHSPAVSWFFCSELNMRLSVYNVKVRRWSITVPLAQGGVVRLLDFCYMDRDKITCLHSVSETCMCIIYLTSDGHAQCSHYYKFLIQLRSRSSHNVLHISLTDIHV